jgi:hypothetical protein
MSKGWRVGETLVTDYGLELTLLPDRDLDKNPIILGNGQKLTEDLVQDYVNCPLCKESDLKAKKSHQNS